jgi:hypothetical protein
VSGAETNHRDDGRADPSSSAAAGSSREIPAGRGSRAALCWMLAREGQRAGEANGNKTWRRFLALAFFSPERSRAGWRTTQLARTGELELDGSQPRTRFPGIERAHAPAEFESTAYLNGGENSVYPGFKYEIKPTIFFHLNKVTYAIHTDIPCT